MSVSADPKLSNSFCPPDINCYTPIDLDLIREAQNRDPIIGYKRQARIQTGLSGLYKPVRFFRDGSTLNNSHTIIILNLNSIVFHYFSRSSFCIIIRLDLSYLSDFLRIKMNTCSCSTFIFLLQYMQLQSVILL